MIILSVSSLSSSRMTGQERVVQKSPKCMANAIRRWSCIPPTTRPNRTCRMPFGHHRPPPPTRVGGRRDIGQFETCHLWPGHCSDMYRVSVTVNSSQTAGARLTASSKARRSTCSRPQAGALLSLAAAAAAASITCCCCCCLYHLLLLPLLLFLVVISYNCCC